MNVSRYFLLIAIVWLLIGMGMGLYMGDIDDFSLRPVHAHINLIGFTLTAIFAAIYKVFPAMAARKLAPVLFLAAPVWRARDHHIAVPDLWKHV